MLKVKSFSWIKIVPTTGTKVYGQKMSVYVYKYAPWTILIACFILIEVQLHYNLYNANVKIFLTTDHNNIITCRQTLLLVSV